MNQKIIGFAFIAILVVIGLIFLVTGEDTNTSETINSPNSTAEEVVEDSFDIIDESFTVRLTTRSSSNEIIASVIEFQDDDTYRLTIRDDEAQEVIYDGSDVFTKLSTDEKYTRSDSTEDSRNSTSDLIDAIYQNLEDVTKIREGVSQGTEKCAAGTCDVFTYSPSANQTTNVTLSGNKVYKIVSNNSDGSQVTYLYSYKPVKIQIPTDYLEAQQDTIPATFQ